MDIVERLRESDNDTEYVSPIGNERRLTLAWEAAEEIERLRERVAYLEGCQCKACKDGVKHWSDCAVHNGDALPVSQCDCGVVATPNVKVSGLPQPDGD